MYMYFKLNEIAHLLLHTHCSLFSDGGLCSFLWFVTTPCILSVSLNTGSQSFVKVCPGSTAVSAPVSQHISLQHDDHCVCARVCMYACCVGEVLMRERMIWWEVELLSILKHSIVNDITPPLALM